MESIYSALSIVPLISPGHCEMGLRVYLMELCATRVERTFPSECLSLSVTRDHLS